MKIQILALYFTIVLVSLSFAQSPRINIIPKPESVVSGTGIFVLSKKTKIVAVNDVEKRLAEVLNDIFQRDCGFRLPVVERPPSKNFIRFEVIHPYEGESPLSGGYSLKVGTNQIQISGEERGIFYASQTLAQVLGKNENGGVQVPIVTIQDRPRFPYRGMHLDVGRHFMPVEFVKKYVDLMAQYKFNYFHWHLTEDQGWRIEIKKYPKLTEVGSKRPETVKDRNLQPYIGDGIPHQGFYTQEQIKDIVAYAKARYITVIPEIELPGHSSAALAAYPEFGCKQDYQYKVQTTWGIFKEVYCPTEKTFQFLEDVISEVVDLFPDSPYIHIGGDEVLKDMWKDSPEVKELMAREGLKDVNEVQSYFIRRMEKFINSKGKKIIGWDEILEGGLAPNATVMSWRGIKGGIEAAKARHDVIMTPTDVAYFDYGQGDPAYEPLNIGNYLTLEKVYSFDPTPKELTADEAKYVIGGQGNVWTEYMATPEKVEYMVFPRMLALAEDVWTARENKNYADFLQRLSGQFARLDKQNVNYRIPEPDGLRNVVVGSGANPVIELKPAIDGAKIFYTLDGSTPDEKSALYEKPIDVDIKQGRRVDLKTVTMLPSGRKSSIYAATILAREYLQSMELTEKRPGATYAFLIPATDPSLQPTLLSGETKAAGFQQFAKFGDLKQPFSVSFDGYLNVSSDAIYEFQTESTWDAGVIVDGEKLIDFIGTKDRSMTSAVVPLKAGYHRISLRYSHHGGNAVFRVRYGIKGQGLRGIGGGELVH